ncbi:putative DNA-binding protein [Paenibacillus aurantius]|uniref:UPF0122 protein MJA45_12005 n=1 Tax=Paenibacillus aurantius TaxID=2918900 RepID=A0AA96LGM1_9BACL|nr:putative DNA-binding protein [Paenibacillus aurantius]WNQ13704.1 putative DNA-binding protein [Paenibacillus aurantius]
MEQNALAKTTRVNLLYDFYAPLLTEKQRTFLSCYFHDDLSLGEIASEFEISRQAVYEHIKRAEATLEEYENKLQLWEKHVQRKALLGQLKEAALSVQDGSAERLAQWIKQLEDIE